MHAVWIYHFSLKLHKGDRVSPHKLGKQTGEMAVKILKDGANVAEMPIESLDDTNICLNIDTAEAIGYEFPQSVTDKAVYLIKGGELVENK